MLVLDGVIDFFGCVTCKTQEVARRRIEHEQVLFCVGCNIFLDELQGFNSAFVVFVFRVGEQEFYATARGHFQALSA